METTAVVLHKPEQITLQRLALRPASAGDVTVAIERSAISTGTERLLWSGTMPSFPGMGYPLVPGYEAVGRITNKGDTAFAVGQRVFVPGAQCFDGARGLFGASASHLVVPATRIQAVDETIGDEAVLLALAATAHHVFAGASAPDLIIGHGVLGRLLARLVIATGHAAPTVWEQNPARHAGAVGYDVISPSDDTRRDYAVIADVSGDSSIIDTLIGRLAPGGEIVLAGFYVAPLQFAFPPAFMKEARLRVAAQWQPVDLAAVAALAAAGALSLSGLITHHAAASDADAAYRTAFEDPGCLKMVLDWSADA